jgi:hypothetical protein
MYFSKILHAQVPHSIVPQSTSMSTLYSLKLNTPICYTQYQHKRLKDRDDKGGETFETGYGGDVLCVVTRKGDSLPNSPVS